MNRRQRSAYLLDVQILRSLHLQDTANFGVDVFHKNYENPQNSNTINSLLCTKDSRRLRLDSALTLRRKMSLISSSNAYFSAFLFLLSGICQPLIMTVCKQAGLANPIAQLYMFFYYLGPALVVLTIGSEPIPAKMAITKACGIAFFDIIAQALNYTGAGLAGSTVFAVIYSSVTIWVAVCSRFVLGRTLNWTQWLAVWIVFGGLALTTLQSAKMGGEVKTGAFLVVLGSAMHAGSYVFSEAIMTHDRHQLSVRQNTAIQSLLATIALGLWQIIYTIPRWQQVVIEPTTEAGTTWVVATIIMAGFGLANLVHSLAFYHTIKHYPGGATSAGVMKGLQAVIVFVFTHILFCGRVGGEEMCFTLHKSLALVTVVTGVVLFAIETEKVTKFSGYASIDTDAVRMPNDNRIQVNDGDMAGLMVV